MACWPRLEASSIRAAATQPPSHPLTVFPPHSPFFWPADGLLLVGFYCFSFSFSPEVCSAFLGFPAARCLPLLTHFTRFLFTHFSFSPNCFSFFSQPPPQRNIRPLLPKSYYYVACFRPFFSFIACCLWRRQQLCRFQLHK